MRYDDLWEEVEDIGTLYKEIDLVVGFEEILFVCATKYSNERYLIMTYDSSEAIYVMRKIGKKDLLEMLDNKITLEQTFRHTDFIYETYINENSDFLKCKKIKSNEYPANKLPKKGEYFDLKSRHIERYKNELKETESIYASIRERYRINGLNEKKYSNYVNEYLNIEKIENVSVNKLHVPISNSVIESTFYPFNISYDYPSPEYIPYDREVLYNIV